MTADDVIKRMIYLRKERGWSQRRLAMESGVEIHTISRMEQRATGWTSKVMDKINAALGGTVFGYM